MIFKMLYLFAQMNVLSLQNLKLLALFQRHVIIHEFALLFSKSSFSLIDILLALELLSQYLILVFLKVLSVLNSFQKVLFLLLIDGSHLFFIVSELVLQLFVMPLSSLKHLVCLELSKALQLSGSFFFEKQSLNPVLHYSHLEISIISETCLLLSVFQAVVLIKHEDSVFMNPSLPQ